MRSSSAQVRERLEQEDRLLDWGRTVADRLTRTMPGWYVLYGAASRRLWAFPCWNGAPAGLLVDGPDPDRLRARMRQAQRTAPPPAELPGVGHV